MVASIRGAGYPRPPGDTPSSRATVMTTRAAEDIEAARLLLLHVRGDRGSSDERAAAAVRVFATLLERLGPIIGGTGVRALFARSVRLTVAEFPALAPLLAPAAVDNDAELAKQIGTCLSSFEPAAAFDATTAVYATLLRLLIDLIGQPLVKQLLKNAFPER